MSLFANPFAANPIGDIQLLVGTEYGQSRQEAQELIEYIAAMIEKRLK
jgi:hypothetical protein